MRRRVPLTLGSENEDLLYDDYDSLTMRDLIGLAGCGVLLALAMWLFATLAILALGGA